MQLQRLRLLEDRLACEGYDGRERRLEAVAVGVEMSRVFRITTRSPKLLEEHIDLDGL